MRHLWRLGGEVFEIFGNELSMQFYFEEAKEAWVKRYNLVKKELCYI